MAQTASTGTVAGTATDETGAPVVAATVTLTGPKTYSTATDAKGHFSIAGIEPGLYLVFVRKAGYDTASRSDFAVIAGQSATLAIVMHGASLTTLHTIASVSTVGRGSINTSTAAVNSIPAATFEQQGQPQVTRTLNQVPGVQISLPQSSANGASPGAIVFPNIRGGLSFETASLVDGHPVSVGAYGDYVTTFLSPYMFEGVDTIKGPGAMSPQVNYAIGGTINFRTKDPTAELTPDYTFGLDNHGGTFFNFGVSDTIGRLGFVVDVAGTNLTNAITNYPATIVPSGAVVTNASGVTGKLGYNDSNNGFVPGTASTYYNQFGLVACCMPVSGTFNGLNELLKFRYKFSNATTATVSYLGSQTLSDQNANTGALSPGVFCPTNRGFRTSTGTGGSCAANAAYTGPFATGQAVNVANIYPVYNREINNEPILQAEVRSTLGNDTVLARFYHAGIQRLKREGGDSASSPTVVNMTLNGVDGRLGAFNNVSTPVSFYDWYNNPEIDSLSGISFEYDHPVADNDYTFAFDQTNSTTVTMSAFADVNAAGAFTGTSVSPGVPNGSSQVFTTFLERGTFQLNPKLSGVLALYQNRYRTTYLQQCGATPVSCSFDYTGAATNSPIFTTAVATHFDERAALEYRPKANLAVRFSAGSAIAPPYLNIYGNYISAPYAAFGSAYATQRYPSTTPIVPETAFGVDLGADYRLGDGATVVSGDVYQTNLRNQFVSGALVNSNLTCATSPFPCTGPAATPSTPIFYSENLNLANSRYEGVELSVKRSVPVGLGFTASASLQHAYAYNLPGCFYGSTVAGTCQNSTLLGIVPGINFTGGQPSQGFISTGSLFNGVSNQNIPYLMANASVNYTFRNRAFFELGDTLYGKNNSLNEPPFGIVYTSLRYPISHSLSVQISGDNILNAYPGLFPIVGNGVPVPIAGVPTGYVAGLPAQAATTAGVLGPATWRFILTKNIGPEPLKPNP